MTPNQGCTVLIRAFETKVCGQTTYGHKQPLAGDVNNITAKQLPADVHLQTITAESEHVPVSHILFPEP